MGEDLVQMSKTRIDSSEFGYALPNVRGDHKHSCCLYFRELIALFLVGSERRHAVDKLLVLVQDYCSYAWLRLVYFQRLDDVAY